MAVLGTIAVIVLLALCVGLGAYEAGTAVSHHADTAPPTTQLVAGNPQPPAPQPTFGRSDEPTCDPPIQGNDGWTNASVTVAPGHAVVADVGRDGLTEVTVFDQSGTYTPVDDGVRVGALWDYGACSLDSVNAQADQHRIDLGQRDRTDIPRVDPTSLFSKS